MNMRYNHTKFENRIMVTGKLPSGGPSFQNSSAFGVQDVCGVGHVFVAPPPPFFFASEPT